MDSFVAAFSSRSGRRARSSRAVFPANDANETPALEARTSARSRAPSRAIAHATRTCVDPTNGYSFRSVYDKGGAAERCALQKSASTAMGEVALGCTNERPAAHRVTICVVFDARPRQRFVLRDWRTECRVDDKTTAPLDVARVERVAQSIADEVERQHEREDRQTRPDR